MNFFGRSLHWLFVFLVLPLASVSAEDTNFNTAQYIKDTALTLQADIRNKKEFAAFYDSRISSYYELHAQFKSELRKKEVQLYTVLDYKNIFNITNIYKQISNLPQDYAEKLTTTLQIDKIISSAADDGKRTQSLKDSLSKIDVSTLDPEVAKIRDQAIADCDTLISMNNLMVGKATFDKRNYEKLNEDMGRLTNEGKGLKTVIGRTLTSQNYYIDHWDSILPVLKDSIWNTYTERKDQDARQTELNHMLISLGAGALISCLGSWLIFGIWMKKILNKRGAFASRSFLVPVGGLLIFSIILAGFSYAGNWQYYQKVTSLGPEFLLSVTIIILALSARLKHAKIWAGIKLYLPMVLTGAVLIGLRLIAAPNVVVCLTLPLVTPLMTLLAAYVFFKSKKVLPVFDRAMGGISLIVLGMATLLSWMGYAFLAFLLLLFWNVLMSCTLFIVAYTAILKHYREKRPLEKPAPWFESFSKKWLIPVLAVFLLLLSFYWPLEIFDLGDDFIKGLNATPETSDGDLVRNFSLHNIVTVIVMAISFNYLLFLAKKALRSIHGEDYEQGGIPTLITLGSLVAWSIFAIIGLFILRANFNGIFVVLGGMSLGIGFALKDTIENIISGISLMFGRLKQGDYVECDGIRGRVTALGYRTTYMETLDGSIIAFQNTQLFNKNFRNLTQNHIYEASGILVGVSYGTDIETLKPILLEAIHNVAEVSKTKSPSIFFDEFGDNAVVVKVVVWVPVPSKGTVLSRVREEIYKALNENNIEIPFPQQDVHIKEMPELSKENSPDDDEKASS